MCRFKLRNKNMSILSELNVPQERYIFKKFKAYNDVVECVYVCKLLKSLHVHVRGSTVTPFCVDTTRNSYQVLIASS